MCSFSLPDSALKFYFFLRIISNGPLMIQSMSDSSEMLNADKLNPNGSWVNTSFSALDSIKEFDQVSARMWSILKEE